MGRDDKHPQTNNDLGIALLPTLQQFECRRHDQQSDHGLKSDQRPIGQDDPQNRGDRQD